MAVRLIGPVLRLVHDRLKIIQRVEVFPLAYKARKSTRTDHRCVALELAMVLWASFSHGMAAKEYKGVLRCLTAGICLWK